MWKSAGELKILNAFVQIVHFSAVWVCSIISPVNQGGKSIWHNWKWPSLPQTYEKEREREHSLNRSLVDMASKSRRVLRKEQWEGPWGDHQATPPLCAAVVCPWDSPPTPQVILPLCAIQDFVPTDWHILMELIASKMTSQQEIWVT